MLKAVLDAFLSGRGSATIPVITVTDALERTKTGDVLLIDVREPDEWRATGSPRGSLRVALQSPDFVNQIRKHSNHRKELPIALCCRSGLRGKKAAELLVQDGFDNVSNVEGGMMKWVSEDLPVDHESE
ncbi:MAG: rhodanese-like domain-containing protein [Pseudomonadota bacterium]